MRAVEFENVEKSFGKIKALSDVSFKINCGEKVALFGPNGSGKTTIVKLISGIFKPTKGIVRVFGKEINEDAKRRMGIVSHNTFLYDDLTAYENLEFFSKIYEAGEGKIRELLEVFGLWNRRNELVKNYSRGMKQRLSIARALLNDPELLILDEPTTGLDIESRDLLFKILRNFEGTVIIATHNSEDVKSICNRILHLDNGKLIFDEEI